MSEREQSRELAKRARNGCETSFAELVRLHADRLYGYLCAKGLNRHDAEDVAQETFVRVYQALDRYDPDRPFRAWLFTIASRQAISHWRKHRKESAQEEIEIIENQTPADTLAERDEAEHLWAIARQVLPEQQYEALWLFYREELSVKEVAKVMRKTGVHVKVLLHRGRKRLGEALESEMKLRPTDEQDSPAPLLSGVKGGSKCSAV